jgi:DNA-binding transcriptional regulator YiaG
MTNKTIRMRCPICGTVAKDPARSNCSRCKLPAEDAFHYIEEDLFEGFKQHYSPGSLRAQRKRLALSVREFALLLFVSPSTVYSWERGRTHPRHYTTLMSLGVMRKLTEQEARERVKVYRNI